MAEIKIPLGHKTRTIKPFGKKTDGQEDRVADVYSIITTDAYNYILSEFEKVDSDDPKSTLEIDGQHYKPLGNNQSYHSNIFNCVRHYVEEQVIKNPNKDITKLSEVKSLYDDALLEFKSLLSL